MADAISNRIAGIYAVHPAEFVRARDALVADLKAAGDEVSAKRVKALRKPPLSVWVVNRLGREQPDRLQELFDAGDALIEAQRSMLRGERSDALAELTAAERRIAASLTDEAMRGLGSGGSPAVRDRIGDTLLALASDPGSREAALAGTLDHDLKRVGFGLDPESVAEPARLPDRAPADDRAERARVKADEAEQRARATAAEAARLDAELRAAERSVAALRHAAERAAAEAREAAERSSALRDELRGR